VLQQRAEIELLGLIEAERSRRSAPKRPPWQSRPFDQNPQQAEERALETFRFSLEALVSIGAVPESDVENWIERYESDAKARERWADVPPDQATEHQARMLLEDRLPPADLDWGSERYEEAIRRFQEAHGRHEFVLELS
jgi:hypothetical protein